MECENIKSVNIPYGVEIIEYCAFNQISSLEQVTIPNSVKSIGHGAFTSTKCTNFTIPSSVKVIEGAAFYNTGWYNAQPDGLLIIDNCIVLAVIYTVVGVNGNLLKVNTTYKWGV